MRELFFHLQKIGLPGSEARKLYEKFPAPSIFKVYLFNITNKDDVTEGAMPVIAEIGPYVFECDSCLLFCFCF